LLCGGKTTFKRPVLESQQARKSDAQSSVTGLNDICENSSGIIALGWLPLMLM
jgi:hypothetical protein